MSWKNAVLIRNFIYRDRTAVHGYEDDNTGKILHVLKTGDNEVCLDEVLREESKKPLEKMLELAE